MSGTSLDGVDGVLCRFDTQGRWAGVQGHVHQPFAAELRQALLALQQAGPNELHRAALAANAVARAYAQVCAELLQHQQLPASAIRAIGAHGQTVRHQPGLHDGIGYTCQLNQPALLAELTGIDVIADLRSRDVAAGGQGAPLVPPFHQAAFGPQDGAQALARAVVNIGGISNLTLLANADQPLRGFDCGPGNALLDHWCQQHQGHDYDAAGRWAASGTVLPELLNALLADPYFAATPPKSTGRDLFNVAWLDAALQRLATPARAEDVQATLSQLTAQVIAADLLRHAPQTSSLVVCGGGALNTDLMQRLQAALPAVTVIPSDQLGLPVLQVEAAAFAWLARMHCHRQPANSPAVTGAHGLRILGACYPA
jgi:anhydro-N-acetylmuramic acid kinase